MSLFTNFLKWESARTVSRITSRRISLECEASRACCRGDKKRLSRGDPLTLMNVEEWGILLLTVPMFRRTNAAGEVQNIPAEDGRVNVVEPRAREARSKGKFKSET